MPSAKERIQAMKIKMLQSLLSPHPKPWHSFPITWYTRPWKHMVNEYVVKKDLTPTDTFYDELLSIWRSTFDLTDPQSVGQLNIEQNSMIKIGNEMIKNAKDGMSPLPLLALLDSNGNLSTSAVKGRGWNFLTRQGLLESIPTEIKNILTTKMGIEGTYIEREPHIKIGQNRKPLSKTKCKEIYRKLLEKKQKRPTAESKLETILHETHNEETWSMRHTLAPSLTKNRKIRELQYKIIHRIINCKTNLKNWRITDNATCDYCKKAEEDIEHLFTCEHNQPILASWNDEINNKLNIEKQWSVKEILLGVEETTKKDEINLALLLVKGYIYQARQKRKTIGYDDFKNWLNAQAKLENGLNKEGLLEKNWAAITGKISIGDL